MEAVLTRKKSEASQSNDTLALARDLYVAMYGAQWHGMSKEHVARTAIEAAEIFWTIWDEKHAPQGADRDRR